MRSPLVAVFAALSSISAAWAAPATLPLDAARSVLHARTHKGGLAAGLAHDHVIAATEMSGTVTFDPTDPTTFSLEVTVPTASLKPDDPELRKRYRLDGEIDADDRETIEKHMKARDQLDVKRYPTIRFVSTAVARLDGDRYMVEGDLTLRGKTQRVELRTQVSMKGGAFEGRGMLSITHRQFGFEPYSAALGAVQNKERIDLMLQLVANKP